MSSSLLGRQFVERNAGAGVGTEVVEERKGLTVDSVRADEAVRGERRARAT